jgi:peptide/nickel transport system ATP-binding protein
MVLGLMPITSGKLIFQGKDVTKLKGRSRTEYWRDVQAVFQDPFSAFNQFFTVGKLLDRSMLMVGKDVGKERLEESLGYVGMDLSVLDRYPHQLSAASGSGDDREGAHDATGAADRRRGDIDARCIAAGQRAQRPQGSSRPTRNDRVVHHSRHRASCYLADRVLVMEHGVMVEQGKTDEVIFNPQHEYTKRLLADVPKLHKEIELHDCRRICSRWPSPPELAPQDATHRIARWLDRASQRGRHGRASAGAVSGRGARLRAYRLDGSWCHPRSLSGRK